MIYHLKPFYLGSSLLKVYGTDADSKFGILRFSISAGDPDNIFRIDSTNGQIYLNKELDFEKNQKYEVNIIVDHFRS